MSAGKCIYNILSNDANVSATVGTKIFPSLGIENIAYPYIVYEMVNLDPTDTKDGVSCLDTEEFEIEIYTKNPSDMSTLGTDVRNALDRYTGTVEGINIQSIKYNAENSGYTDGDRIYLKMQSYSIRIIKS
jgi:hypothetical protein